MTLAFDFATEEARFLARKPVLDRHWAQRMELATGVVFQPETLESVKDQMVETLWAEGKTLESIDADEEIEVLASFSVLSPRREYSGYSIAASLLFGFPEASRDAKLESMMGFPDQLLLELGSGDLIRPEVDRGTARPEDRLPAVLALRYFIPEKDIPVALVSTHPTISGRFFAPPSWAEWIPSFRAVPIR